MEKKQLHKPKWLVTMLLLVMAILMPYGGAWAQTASQPSEGDGSSNSPYIITKAAELAWFRDQVNSGKYRICAKIADNVEGIDLSTVCHAADASQNLNELSWEPIGNDSYQGTFDGNGKTITNLYINANQNGMVFFGYTLRSRIKNLTFGYANVTNTESNTGILVGSAGGSTLQNIMISTTCNVNGGIHTGGIAGDLDGNAYNCVNYATVQGQEDVGGLFGSYNRYSMTACANYGNVTATRKNVGGLVGFFDSGTIQDCANYGDVKGPNRVAGMAGYVSQGKIQNVFSYGSISATDDTQEIGMAFGYSNKGGTEGMVAYYSGAKLTVNSQEQTVKAFGYSKLSEDNATGFTEAQLKSGVVAYQLQQNASSEAKWGQNLANDGDNYPVIGSEYTVYATEDLLVNCKTNEVVTGSFTNNPTSSAIRYQHGTTNHHAATDATCTEAATKEYWQCQDCLRTYSDSQLTKELTDVTDAEKPVLGHNYNEDGYCDRCQHYVAVKPSQEKGVYLIAKPYHLAWFRDYVNGTIVDEGEVAGTTHPSASAMLTADIDLKNYCHAADTKYTEELSWNPIGNSDISYQGTFDGKGKTISNLYINAISENTGFMGYAGFFGYVDAGSIKNITFNNAKVNSTGFRSTGILAGGAGSCIIEDIKTLASCSVEGIDNVGGIVGMAKGNISNCENHAAVKGAVCVGGIAGWYDGSDNSITSITSCANYGVVTGSGNNVGGMVGYFRSGTIQNSANYGNITGYKYVGNLIGEGIICNLNNVLGTGNVTATSNTKFGGLLVGCINYSSSTASGILAYNSSAKLTINKTEQTDGAVKAIGQGSLTYPDGKKEAEVIKAFNPEQLKSGEVAYLLNGSKSEGELAWYQKLLGAEADAYPVLTAAEGNTVYKVSYCDGTDSSYSNSSSENELVHVASATLNSPVFDSAKLIYHMGCSNESCPEHKYVADADGTLEATKSTDGKFYVEELNLTDASAINTQAQFTVKDLQYSRQLNEGQKGYVTLCLPFDINVANVTGVEKCYPVGDMMIHMPTEDASVLKFVLMLDEQSDIKAGTPMIVKLGAEGTAQKLVAKAQNVEYNAASAAKSLTLRDWDGKSGFMTICHELESASIGGVYTTTPMAEGSYSFREDGKFGIHTGDLSPYRMYLNVQPSQSTSSRTMLFSIGLPDDSSTTGIRIISLGDGKQTGSSAIYTLEGQRVMGTPRQGIYIKNGKKFSVK